MVVGYDPTGAAYSFSPIAFNGQFVQGLGATEDARWDNSLKYRVSYSPVHLGAMYKFADGGGGCNYIGTDVKPKDTPQICYPTNNTAYQFNLGGTLGGLDTGWGLWRLSRRRRDRGGQFAAQLHAVVRK